MIVEQLVIHCSDTPAGRDISAQDIRQWHVEGNGWRDIGYHYVIRVDGTLEKGRPDNEPGAHARGHNHNSIGICLVGGTDGATFTTAQWRTLEGVVRTLLCQHQGSRVIGHNQVSEKQCPCFDVTAWVQGL